MKEALLQYRRLPGVGAGLFQHFRLYLGPDHLLAVTSTGFTETYARFHFNDIQSVSVRKSNQGKVWNIVWGVLCWTFGIGMALQFGGGAMYFWLASSGFFLALLLFNIARGPTCVTLIQTAVQSRKLPSLSRLRRARKVIAQLKPLIEVAQGSLTPEELTHRIDQARRGVAPVAQPASTSVATSASAPNSPLSPSG